MRQSRCVSNKMIAAMRKQIRTLDYRSGQHYMTVCVPNKYFVARTGQYQLRGTGPTAIKSRRASGPVLIVEACTLVSAVGF